MKKKHKAYRHITAENISISILQNHTIPKHSFVDHPLQSISKQCLGTGNIPVNKSESVDFIGSNFYPHTVLHEKKKFRLCFDRIPILEWFKMKFKEYKKRKNRPKRGLRT